MTHKKDYDHGNHRDEERKALNAFLRESELYRLFQEFFTFEYPRASPERDCQLLSVSLRAPEESYQEALNRNEVWGPTIQLHFRLTEFEGVIQEKTFVFGPIPTFTSQDTLVFDGLEREPDFENNGRRTIAECLKSELIDVLAEVSKNLRFWIPRKKGKTGEPSLSIEALLKGYFRTQPSAWGDNDDTRHRWINIRLKKSLRELKFTKRCWGQGKTGLIPNTQFFCIVDSQFALRLQHQQTDQYFVGLESGAFSRMIPGVAPEALEYLSEDGLPQVGTRLRVGDILVGKISESGEDKSARVPSTTAPDSVWTILSAQLSPDRNRVLFKVRKTHAVEPGDVLIDRSGREVSVAEVAELDGVDILWPHESEDLELTIARSARATMSAYRWGDVSTYPFQPRHPRTGQAHVLPEGFIESLVEEKAMMTAREFLREKSDGYFGECEDYSRYRDLLQEELLQGRYPNLREFTSEEKYSALPEGISAAQKFLNVLGFCADFDVKSFNDRKGRLRTLGKEEFVALSKKPIETSEDLFSKVIFGPSEDFVCGCGVWHRRRFPDEYCPKCGVKLMRRRGRLENFGYIQTESPLLRPGLLSAVTEYLGYSEDELQDLLNGSLFLVKNSKDKRGYRLLRHDDAKIEHVPWNERITGIEAFEHLVDGSDSKETIKKGILNKVLVLPPALRPPEHSSLNLAYENIIWKNNRLRRFTTGVSTDSWLNQELRASYKELCTGQNQDNLVNAVQERLSAKGLLCKSVDFSARLQAVSNQRLAEDTCALPFSVAKDLFFDFGVALLKGRQFDKSYIELARHIDEDTELGKEAIREAAESWPVCLVSETKGCWTVCKVQVYEGVALKVTSGLAEKFGCETVQAHVPLSFPAAYEMKSHIGRVHEFTPQSIEVEGWFSEIIAGKNVLEALSDERWLLAPDTTFEESLQDSVLLLALGGIPRQTDLSLAEKMQVFREQMKNERWLTRENYEGLDPDYVNLRDRPYELQDLPIASYYQGQGVYLPNYDWALEGQRLRGKTKQIEEIRKLKRRLRPHD